MEEAPQDVEVGQRPQGWQGGDSTGWLPLTWGQDGKKETTLLQEENMGKASRKGQGKEEGKADWFITLVDCISHVGMCLGRTLLCPHLWGAQHWLL